MHIEGIWGENVFTAEGDILHDKVHDDLPVESRVDVRITRGLQLRSLRFGLTGKADVVEFHRVTDGAADSVHTSEGFEIQLCAQALCLKEMMGVAVPAGAIFFGKPHRRLKVIFDSSIRKRTEQAANRMHELIRANQTPPARLKKMQKLLAFRHLLAHGDGCIEKCNQISY